MEISTQQIVDAAGAGLNFLDRDTTLVPGDLRKQLAVLEVVLQGVATGNLRVVTPDQLRVQSEKGPQDPKNADNDSPE